MIQVTEQSYQDLKNRYVRTISIENNLFTIEEYIEFLLNEITLQKIEISTLNNHLSELENENTENKILCDSILNRNKHIEFLNIQDEKIESLKIKIKNLTLALLKNKKNLNLYKNRLENLIFLSKNLKIIKG